MGEYGAIFIEIADREHLLGKRPGADLNCVVAALRSAAQRSRDAKIELTIGGYDEDPRELWDIDEARCFVQRFAQASGLNDWTRPLFQQLSDQTKGLFVKCDALDVGHPFRVFVG